MGHPALNRSLKRLPLGRDCENGTAAPQRVFQFASSRERNESNWQLAALQSFGSRVFLVPRVTLCTTRRFIKMKGSASFLRAEEGRSRRWAKIDCVAELTGSITPIPVELPNETCVGFTLCELSHLV